MYDLETGFFPGRGTGGFPPGGNNFARPPNQLPFPLFDQSLAPTEFCPPKF